MLNDCRLTILLKASAMLFLIMFLQPDNLLAQKPDKDTSKLTANSAEISKSGDFVPFDTPPVLITAPEPEYPEKALKAKTEGMVWVKAHVDTDGNVIDVEIAKSSELDAGFEESVLKNALKRKYKPALQNSQPVSVWVTYKVEFKLK